MRALAALRFCTLRSCPERKAQAAHWFHSKWRAPEQAYLDCMDAYLSDETEYGWEFLCTVQADGEATPSRMYVHRA